VIEQLLAAVDSVLPDEALTTEQRIRMMAAFERVLDVSPTRQVCDAIDQLKQRGIGVTAVKCGGLELALYQLHKPGKPAGDETPADDDPLFDAVR
jgi:hypothetical protein